MTTVANNLPGYMQYLDLVRDCIAVFGLWPLPPNDVETAHSFHETMDRPYTYASYDIGQHRNDVKSELYIPAVHILGKAKQRERREKLKIKERAAMADSNVSSALVTSTEVPNKSSECEKEHDQLLLASVGGEEEIATFSHNNRTAMSVGTQAQQIEASSPGKETAAADMQD